MSNKSDKITILQRVIPKTTFDLNIKKKVVQWSRHYKVPLADTKNKIKTWHHKISRVEKPTLNYKFWFVLYLNYKHQKVCDQVLSTNSFSKRGKKKIILLNSQRSLWKKPLPAWLQEDSDSQSDTDWTGRTDLWHPGSVHGCTPREVWRHTEIGAGKFKGTQV